MQDLEIVFYEKEDGTKPAKDFILGLDVKMRAKMFRCVDMLRKNGSKLREPTSKPLDDGIYVKLIRTHLFHSPLDSEPLLVW